MDVLFDDLRPLVEVLSMSALLIVFIRSVSTWYLSYHNRNAEVRKGFWGHEVLDYLLVGIKATDAEKQASVSARKQRASASGKTSPFGAIQSILFSFVGLQASFLTWGWIQERLMTTKYDGVERFPSSNMLVLSNRVFAIVFSYIAIAWKRRSSSGSPQRASRAPFTAFTFPAIANTVSSFAAYESLKFMSFPTSTVCKTLKIIPTMVVGTFVHRKPYSMHAYISALVITLGAALFAVEFGAGGLESLFEHSETASLQSMLPGLVLMGTYLAVDAFTSNLQTLLFSEYLLNPYECMLGINLVSIFLSLFNLAHSHELVKSVQFVLRHPLALADLILLALSSASGQLFIYYTIERHGPVTFTIIQLTRQLLAILLSSWSFGHVVNYRAWTGILLTFAGMLAMNLEGKISSTEIKVAQKQKGQ